MKLLKLLAMSILLSSVLAISGCTEKTDSGISVSPIKMVDFFDRTLRN